jgi:hypothetical protein
MPIEPEVGCAVLLEVATEFKQLGLKYWIGRGIFRHWTLRHEFGDEQDDIDFHVLRREESEIQLLVDGLCGKGFEKVRWNDRGYKIPLMKVKVPVELIFLEPEGKTFWFRGGGHGQKRYTCPASVFADRRIEICGAELRVPSRRYLPSVYGPDWKDEEQKNGGVLIE